MLPKLRHAQPQLCREDAKQKQYLGPSFLELYLYHKIWKTQEFTKNLLPSLKSKEEKAEKSREGEVPRRYSPGAEAAPVGWRGLLSPGLQAVLQLTQLWLGCLCRPRQCGLPSSFES